MQIKIWLQLGFVSKTDVIGTNTTAPLKRPYFPSEPLMETLFVSLRKIRAFLEIPAHIGGRKKAQCINFLR